ncbi:Transcription factor bye1 [Cyphellophora attinorum]|uniref:Transcription factor BYE1 n=1 Tax=Cyphellophora attinorum TaxID=1664694 RepID=A0A0N0NM64_9EURO|nr:Transcription factor bye1 [Phialophora attinorum]KPI40091.1 Transcription factor bye1 [Phialophora attinorum]
MAGTFPYPDQHPFGASNADCLSTDETRRSGRATKGQHTKDRDVDMNEAPAASKKKGTAKKASKKKEEEEPEEKIRCVCGEYEEETDIPRAMICCDNCDVWQHNDCMGFDEEYAPDTYYCEECKPENHKKLLAAIKKGQKPWEAAAKKRAALIEAEDAKKGKKGKKGGRKSAAAMSEEVETPVGTPTAGTKRKAEDSPAPSETKINNKKARGTPTPAAEAAPSGRGRKAAQSTPVPAPAATKDPSDLPASRRPAATGLVKLFIDQTKSAVKDGFTIPSNTNVTAYGTNIGMAVEAALHDAHETDAYKAQLSAILLNVKRNNILGGRVVRNEVRPDELASMPPAAMASEEQQRKDAEMQAQLDKQSTLVGQEPEGPRIRRTHKGDEYVDDLNKSSAGEVNASKPPQPQRQTSTAEVKSPTHTARRPPSVTIPNRRPSQDPRRQSSSGANFDISNVYSNVQGSPTGDQRFGEIVQPSREAAGPGTQADADIDNLLKDENDDEQRPDTPPYSPRFSGEDEHAVWHGLINGGNVGSFNAALKFAAGAAIDAPTLRLTWEQLLPGTIGISGRIDPKKAEDYLCGLEFSQTSDLIVLWTGEPNNEQDAESFNYFFNYFKRRDRYGVGSQQHNPALKDIYFIPLEKDQAMPTFFANLQTDFTQKAAERMILVPLVIKNSELPHNRMSTATTAVGESPGPIGGAVMQTPITPRDSFAGPFDGSAANGGNGMYGGTPVPVNGAQGVRPPLPQQPQAGQGYPFTTQQPQFAGMPPGSYQGSGPPPPGPAAAVGVPPPQLQQTPSQAAALKILGPQLSLAPAVQQLCMQAKDAGEQEMIVIKECLAENPAAQESLDVLTRALTEKWSAQRSTAAAGGAPTDAGKDNVQEGPSGQQPMEGVQQGVVDADGGAATNGAAEPATAAVTADGTTTAPPAPGTQN